MYGYPRDGAFRRFSPSHSNRLFAAECNHRSWDRRRWCFLRSQQRIRIWIDWGRRRWGRACSWNEETSSGHRHEWSWTWQPAWVRPSHRSFGQHWTFHFRVSSGHHWRPPRADQYPELDQGFWSWSQTQFLYSSRRAGASRSPKGYSEEAGGEIQTHHCVTCSADRRADRTDDCLSSTAAGHPGQAERRNLQCHSCARASAWRRSSGKTAGCLCRFCQGTSPKSNKRLGTCSKNKTGPSPRSHDSSGHRGKTGRRGASGWKPHIKGFDATVGSHYQPSCPPHCRRSHGRTGDAGNKRAFHEYQRRSKKRAHASGALLGKQLLLPPGASTSSQENASSEASAAHRERVASSRHQPDSISGEIRRFPQQAGGGHVDVDVGPQCRRSSPGKPPSLQGVPGIVHGLFGAGDIGWELECGMGVVAPGGTADDGVFGEIQPCLSTRETILPAHPSSMVGDSPCLFEGSRTDCNQKERISGEQTEPAETARSSSEAKPEAAKVPKEAKRRCRARGQGDMKAVDARKAVLPCNHNSNRSHNRKINNPVDFASELGSSHNPSNPEPHSLKPHHPGGDNPGSTDMHSIKLKPGPCALGSQEDSAVSPPETEHAKVFQALCSETLSYPKWCTGLAAFVMRSKAPFSAYVSKTIHLSRSSRSGKRSTPTFFPIPIPEFGVFDRMPRGSSPKFRHELRLKQAIHLVTCAMNYWFSGGSFGDLELLRRKPNPQQQEFYGRVKLLIESEGPAEINSIPKTGRRFPELIARLSELSESLTRHGTTTNPYDKSFAGVEVPKDEQAHESLQPYHDADPSKLKLFGRGAWDPCPHLSDELCMAFREPKTLLHGVPTSECPQIRDSPSTMATLAMKWDELDLLYIHDEDIPAQSLVRIFGALKDRTTHRQIGDKRGQNARESRVQGPSKDLPAGPDFVDLFVDASKDSLLLSVTDRRDFYHQLKITESKAITNTIGPAIPRELLQDTKAFSHFMLRSSRKRYDRSRHGDLLDMRLLEDKPETAQRGSGEIWASFLSVLQGDHAGVEVATESHTSLLRSYGLLQDGSRMTASQPLRSETFAEGLVIDDFFAVSVQPQDSDPGSSAAARSYRTAQEAYNQHSLLGSPQKDVISADEGRVIGAYLNSSSRALSRGVVTVASPPGKRLALSFLTFQVCQLGFTTDALHLCIIGGWVSMMSYRRPLMSVFQHSFNLVKIDAFDRNHPKVIPLPRKVADELCIAATLIPLMLTDIATPFDHRVFCTDASNTRGAALSAEVGDQISQVLWRASRSKGAYSRLLSPIEATLKHLGELEEVREMSREAQRVDRPLAFAFDFIEVFSGAGKITHEVHRLGFSVGPPIDIEGSAEFDLKGSYVVQWLTHLIADHRLWGFFLSPPCTTFSIMRRPRLRSELAPLGFEPDQEQTQTGNILAHRALQIMTVSSRNHAVGINETPYSSYMKHLPSWKAVRQNPEVQEVRTDSCRFGSQHQKSFRFMGLRTDMKTLAKRCTCTGPHVPVEGKFTKLSATYTDSLAAELAEVITASMQQAKDNFFDDHDLEAKGLESQLVNEVMLSAPWEVVIDWRFRKASHINILEESAVYRLISKIAKECKPSRITILVDSSVVKCATAKGRSSSLGLSPVLRRVCALVVASGLYVNLAFVPTRLNAADDPTRDTILRGQVCNLHLEEWDTDQLYSLAAIPKSRRWASNWVRLVLCVLGPNVLGLSDRSVFRQLGSKFSLSDNAKHTLDFDCTLGFPGEGPKPSPTHTHASGFKHCSLPPKPCRFLSLRGFLLVVLLGFLHLWTFISAGGAVPLLLLGVLAQVSPAMAMPSGSATAAELRRAALRAERPELQVGRPVTAATTAAREKHWKFFLDWAAHEGIDLDTFLNSPNQWVEEINCVFSKFGRFLYKAGKTYNQYAETINALSSKKPSLRRLMQQSWDFGYAWVRAEPSVHHVAIPVPVIMAMVTTALVWGWVREASCLALGFAALLRPGELTGALRKDLLLPRDVGGTIKYGLLSIREPKSRFTHARHQSAKFDSADFIQVIDLGFGSLQDHERLWPYSPQTLRSRFREILIALKLPTQSTYELKALDLGSLRSGGATFIMQSTENSDLCRRRGRWANMKMMDIYVQETMALQFMRLIPVQTRDHVLQIASAFLDVLARTKAFSEARIPSRVWFFLLSRWKTTLIVKGGSVKMGRIFQQ